MKDLLTLINALPTPAPVPDTTREALSQHAQILAALQDKIVVVYWIAVIACIIAILSFGLNLYLAHHIDRQGKRLRQLKRMLPTSNESARAEQPAR